MHLLMLHNYLLVALRNMRKQIGYAVINVVGLGIGIACCILIGLFVRNELSYDRFHEKADRIYRGWTREKGANGHFTNTMTPLPLGPALTETYPEVESSVRIGNVGVLVGLEQPIYSRELFYVDPEFFDVFSFPLLEGSPSSVLSDPGNIVLTESTADFLFGEEDPMGRTLTVRLFDESRVFVVSGIAKDPPAASSISFGMMVPFEVARAFYSPGAYTAWFNISVETYVVLRDGVDVTGLRSKFPGLVRQHVGAEFDEDAYQVGIQPLTDIHLNPDMPSGFVPPSDPRYLTILSVIAFFILVIACINFISLSLGQSVRRGREVGMRKVMGAVRQQLMGQFWGEALALTGFAILLGVALTTLLLPFFNSFADRELAFTIDSITVLSLLLLLLLVSALAGLYPAVVLSGFEPLEAIRERLKIGSRGILWRSMVVVQFSLSIVLLIATIVMSGQLRYLQTKSLGFDQEQVVVIQTGLRGDEATPLLERVANRLQDNNAIAGFTNSAYMFGEGWLEVGFTDEGRRYREFMLNWGAADYPSMMGFQIADGRLFNPALPTDSSAILVNETLVTEFGLSDPVGTRLAGANFPDHEIIGVVRDFNFESLHGEIRPLVIAIDPRVMLDGAENVNSSASSARKIAVRLRAGRIQEGLQLLEATWKEAAPGRPFEYSFLDDAVERQYEQEARLGRIVTSATTLAILIACLGLFGLATLTVARRTKEVGIRKVLGASVSSITTLLSRDFLKPVLIASVIAAPIAYFAMSSWLEGFAYRISLGPTVFLVAALIAVVVALVTVSYQSLRAATADPVKSVRYE